MKGTHSTAVAILLYLSFLLLPPVLVAQSFPTLYFSETDVRAGENVRIDLLTDNFLDISTVQFTIGWDSTVLQLKDISEVQFESILPDVFFTDQAGKLIFVGINESGVSLEDGTALFAMQFEVIGRAGDSTRIGLLDSPPAEFTQRLTDTTDIVITDSVRFEEQLVRVTTTSSTTSYIADGYQLHASPNPFQSQTTITWNQVSSARIHWTLTDALGKRIDRGSFTASAGRQQLPLRLAESLPAGTYFFHLLTNNQTRTLKLLTSKP